VLLDPGCAPEKQGSALSMDASRNFTRRIRHEIDEPGVKASIAADVNVVVSTGSAGGNATQHVHVRQGRSARTGDAENEEKS
jgi:hypothetical protein